MIQEQSHACIYVLDQDEALDFYVNKLGFEVRTDIAMGDGFRWLTVGSKAQSLELILMSTKPSGMMDEATSHAIRGLLQAGKLTGGVMRTADCQKTYEELLAKGVTFMQPPWERFYGTEVMMKDNSGNWVSIVQPKEGV